MFKEIPMVLEKLRWMKEQEIWPNGLRYLWTDAFGVVLLVSLYHELGEERYLTQAKWVVSEVERVLGRPRGIRIGEAPDRDGQYYHYLAMWLYALHCLGEVEPAYQKRALDLVGETHPRFVKPGLGVYWKMKEDLSGPYPGYGLGALDPFNGYVVYRLLAPQKLSAEIDEMKALMDKNYTSLHISQDLGVGMMLWLTHFFPREPWAATQSERSLAMLDRLWIDPPGYFCRRPELVDIKFAFTNYGISVGLQAAGEQQERAQKLNAFFRSYRSADRYDRQAITHVMACTSRFAGEFIKK